MGNAIYQLRYLQLGAYEVYITALKGRPFSMFAYAFAYAHQHIHTYTYIYTSPKEEDLGVIFLSFESF